MGEGGLTARLAETWARLEAGATQRRHAFHTASVASVDASGRPHLRTVVLRAADADGWTLRFHTDQRAPKVAEITRNPAVALCFYDPAEGLQVRAEGQARIHRDDDVAAAAWAASQPMSRICYGVEPGPSVEIEGPDTYRLPHAPHEIEAGRAHFCAVIVQIEALDWLYLAAGQNVRASFLRGVDGSVSARWLSP
jgi:hypothetical protein